MTTITCNICGRAGRERYCKNTVACNFRARRRLGIPYGLCVQWRARDLERIELARATSREAPAA